MIYISKRTDDRPNVTKGDPQLKVTVGMKGSRFTVVSLPLFVLRLSPAARDAIGEGSIWWTRFDDLTKGKKRRERKEERPAQPEQDQSRTLCS